MKIKEYDTLRTHDIVNLNNCTDVFNTNNKESFMKKKMSIENEEK
jgi:hypothetical protein